MQSYYFSTFTVQNWVPVFKDIPESNSIILNTFVYLMENDGVSIYAFVIMRDHLHIVWRMNEGLIKKVTHKFKRFTGSEIVKLMQRFESNYLENFISEQVDRKHKFWKTDSGCLHLKHPNIVWQKIKYIHNNPIKGNYRSVEYPEDYLYSSAYSYACDQVLYSFLFLYNGRL